MNVNLWYESSAICNVIYQMVQNAIFAVNAESEIGLKR
jgi:hypothetical protein